MEGAGQKGVWKWKTCLPSYLSFLRTESQAQRRIVWSIGNLDRATFKYLRHWGHQARGYSWGLWTLCLCCLQCCRYRVDGTLQILGKRAIGKQCLTHPKMWPPPFLLVLGVWLLPEDGPSSLILTQLPPQESKTPIGQSRCRGGVYKLDRQLVAYLCSHSLSPSSVSVIPHMFQLFTSDLQET